MQGPVSRHVKASLSRLPQRLAANVPSSFVIWCLRTVWRSAASTMAVAALLLARQNLSRLCCMLLSLGALAHINTAGSSRSRRQKL